MSDKEKLQKLKIYIGDKLIGEATPWTFNADLEKQSPGWEDLEKKYRKRSYVISGDHIFDFSTASNIMAAKYCIKRGLKYYFKIETLHFHILIRQDQEEEFKRFKFKRGQEIYFDYSKPGTIKLFR